MVKHLSSLACLVLFQLVLKTCVNYCNVFVFFSLVLLVFLVLLEKKGLGDSVLHAKHPQLALSVLSVI